MSAVLSPVQQDYHRWRSCASKTIFYSHHEAELAVRSWKQRKVEMTYYRCVHGCRLWHLATVRGRAA